MSENIDYVGIDVDDVRYHGSALNPRTGEVLDFRCRPTSKGLVGQLEKLREHSGEVQLKLCYEASSLGVSFAERGNRSFFLPVVPKDPVSAISIFLAPRAPSADDYGRL